MLGSNFSDAYGKPKGAGTNIEGIAIIGDRLYAGLRTPTGSSEAFIVSAPVKDLFALGPDRLKAGVVESFTVDLGTNTGIRDLAALGNNRLLILAGPSVEQAGVEYRLWLLEKPAGRSREETAGNGYDIDDRRGWQALPRRKRLRCLTRPQIG